ncbi:hypothetical protein M9458_037588, partial [Cirrhinus mrigala]
MTFFADLRDSKPLAVETPLLQIKLSSNIVTNVVLRVWLVQDARCRRAVSAHSLRQNALIESMSLAFLCSRTSSTEAAQLSRFSSLSKARRKKEQSQGAMQPDLSDLTLALSPCDRSPCCTLIHRRVLHVRISTTRYTEQLYHF